LLSFSSFHHLSSEYGMTGQQGLSASFASSSPLAAPPEAAFAPFVPLVPPQETPVANERRFLIRTDTNFDAGTRILTALLELPGMKKRDLSITLATTLFNRVRQVTVNGQSRPPFPPSLAGPVLRERKYGRFTRAFPVPADTKVRPVPSVPLRLTRIFVCQRLPFSLPAGKYRCGDGGWCLSFENIMWPSGHFC
jgi:hypothetical protein